MTIHEALFSPARELLMPAVLLLLCLQMILIFASVRDGRSRALRGLYFLHFLVSFLFLYFPLFDLSRERTILATGSGTLPAPLAVFRGWPVTVMILYGILTAGILAAAFGDLFRYRRNHPTFDSIKETMDLLPAGIAFGKPDGTVVFSNLAMNRLFRGLTGKRLTDLNAFRDPGGAAPESVRQVTLPDGSAVWQVAAEPLDVDGEKYLQLTATDITAQAAVTAELQEKNKTLRDIHMRLDLYNKQADRIVIAQELLTARMAVHNEVGNVLLESRHYLKDPSSFDEGTLLQALKNTNTYLLREYEADDSAGDPLAEALETAEAIGVDVSITGVIPPEGPARTVLAAAVGECATNTVKHADGDRLSVEIRKTGTETVFTLRNNGEQPGKAVRESGGLLSLRSLAEKEGGTMRISASPDFELTIRLPEAP